MPTEQIRTTTLHANSKNIFIVDDISDLPIWVQLRNRMSYLIRTGHFQEGEQLPSIRSLSADAKINYNTVAKAYRELELEGLIVNIRGRGMFVKRGLPANGNPERDAVDTVLENCIERYCSLGMTLQETDEHIRSIMAKLLDEADRFAEERKEFSDVE